MKRLIIKYHEKFNGKFMHKFTRIHLSSSDSLVSNCQVNWSNYAYAHIFQFNIFG